MPAWKPPKEHRHSTTWTRQVREMLSESLGKTAVIAAVVWVHTRPHRGEDGAMQPGTRPGLKVQWGVPGGHLRWQAFPYTMPSRTEKREDPLNVADEIALGIRQSAAIQVAEKAARGRMNGAELGKAYGASPSRMNKKRSIDDSLLLQASILGISPEGAHWQHEVAGALRVLDRIKGGLSGIAGFYYKQPV